MEAQFVRGGPPLRSLQNGIPPLTHPARGIDHLAPHEPLEVARQWHLTPF